ncbi:MAG: PD-(D/E)XK nuclease family protein [Cellulophaga sp.]
MGFNLEHLQTFLNQNDIPKIKGKPKTFLGIAKQPHYENVLSNIYAFYFNVNEEHQLNDLFVTSLLDCIKESKLASAKETLQTFYDFDVETEFTTLKGGRIDLLLSNKEQAIIIENKVYHHLNNNLKDYWESIKVLDNNKIGVVLSLHPISNIKHSDFINITHLQLLNKAMHKLGKYLLNANDKYVVFLKDFYQNTINLSHPFMEKDTIDFYLKNQSRINDIFILKASFKKHIASELVKAGQTLENLNPLEPNNNSHQNGRLVYYISPKNANLFFTILYEDLLKEGKTIIIKIEFQGVLLNNRGVYKKDIDFTQEEEANYAEHFETTNLNFAHFMQKEYELSNHDITNLSSFIQERLEDDHLLSAFRKIELFLASS